MFNHLRETRVDTKRLIYKFILISIILSSISWVVAFKVYLYGASGRESIVYWLISLNIYALGFGALFGVFSVMLYPKEIAFWIYLVIRSFGDVMTNLSDLRFIDKLDMEIFAPKLILTLVVLTLTIKKLKRNGSAE